MSAKNKRRSIAIFDIDGTIFRSSLLIEAVDKLIEEGVFPKDSDKFYQEAFEGWLNRETSYYNYIRGVVDAFESSIVGVEEKVFKDISEQVINELSNRTYQFTQELIDKLKSSHFVVAISGSPEELVGEFAKVYGFDDFRATEAEIKNGKYTGQFKVGDRHKDKVVKELVKQHNLTLDGSYGVGDTESDIKFLKLVDNPVAFNPNDGLFKEAINSGWQVVLERKNVVYHLNRGGENYELTQTDFR